MKQHVAFTLAFALAFSLVAFPNLVTRCTAQDVARAALPEIGLPPEPPAIVQPASLEPVAPQVASEPVSEPSSEISSEPATAEVATPADVAQVRELSVAPDVKPLLPLDRPAWVGAAPDLSTNTHRLFVGSDATVKPEETETALDDALVASVNGYIDEYVLKNGGAEKLRLKPDYIRNKLVDRSTDYLAEWNTSQGPMYQKWVVVQISPENRSQFLEQYRQVEQVHRLVALGIGVTGLLTLTGAANLAFNRRRRRYDALEVPAMTGVYPLAAKGQPPVLKSNRHKTGWGLLALGVMVVLFTLPTALFFIRHSRERDSSPVRLGIVEAPSDANARVVESNKRSRRTTTRITTSPASRTVEIHSENY